MTSRKKRRDWRNGNARRCSSTVYQSGAGYRDTHQCSFTAIVEYNGRPVCGTHLRKELRRANAARLAFEQ